MNYEKQIKKLKYEKNILEKRINHLQDHLQTINTSVSCLKSNDRRLRSDILSHKKPDDICFDLWVLFHTLNKIYGFFDETNDFFYKNRYGDID